jgi:hypothetical protein
MINRGDIRGTTQLRGADHREQTCPLQRSLRFRANILEMKEGRSGSNDHIADPSHRELLWSKAMVVSIAEKSGRKIPAGMVERS